MRRSTLSSCLAIIVVGFNVCEFDGLGLGDLLLLGVLGWRSGDYDVDALGISWVWSSRIADLLIALE